ncbi:MAG: hypothetical protein IJW14_01055 [Oscillospiraceae bacterium]|nr:hypothetical protein [Oscillospiraceae bacterium]
MTKRLFCAFLALIMALSLVACSSSGSETQPVVKDPIVIDYFQAISIYCSGVSGSGTMTISKNLEHIQYDKTNTEIVEFIKDITVKANKDSALSNGDAITISLSYSYEEAARLGIMMKSTAQKYTVHGLYSSTAIKKTSSVQFGAIEQKMIKRLEPEETIIGAYFLFNDNADPDSDEDRRVVSEVIFIISNGTHCYNYAFGINDYGHSYNKYTTNYGKAVHHNWTTEDAVYADLCELYGESSLTKIS